MHMYVFGQAVSVSEWWCVVVNDHFCETAVLAPLGAAYLPRDAWRRVLGTYLAALPRQAVRVAGRSRP